MPRLRASVPPMLVLLLVLLPQALLAGPPIRGERPPSSSAPHLGMVDFPACVEIQGNRSFDADRIRRALAGDGPLVAQFHPLAPRRAALVALGQSLHRSYQALGFPEVRVDCRWQGGEHPVAIEVMEGPRYEGTGIRVKGTGDLPERDVLEAAREAMGKAGVENEEASSFAPKVTRAVETAIRDLCAGRGFLFAKCQTRMLPLKGKREAVLEVDISELGPRCTLGKVHFEGGKRHGDAELLKRCGLKPGQGLTRPILNGVLNALRASGRFLSHELEPKLVDEKTGRSDLELRLVDFPEAPPLGESLTAGQRCFLALAGWLGGLTKGEEEIHFRLAPALCRGWAVSGILAPKRGLLVTTRKRTGNWPVDLQLLVTPTRVALLDGIRHEKLLLDGLDGRLVTELSVAPSGATSGSDLFTGRLGFRFDSKGFEGGSGVSVEANLAPVAFIGAASKGRSKVRIRDEAHWSLSIQGTELSAEAIVRRSDGALVELSAKRPGSSRRLVELRSKSGRFEAEVSRSLARARKWPSILRPSEPMVSAGAFLLEELTRLGLALGERPGPWPTETLRAVFFAPVLRTVAELLDRQGPKLPGDAFAIATAEGKGPGGTLALFAPPLAWAASSRGPFPVGSWPRSLARIWLAVALGRSDSLPWDLGRLDGASDAGPFSRLLMALAIRPLVPKAARQFAIRGLEELELRGLARDLRLLRTLPFLRRASAAMLTTLRSLEAEKLEALAKGLPLAEGTTLRKLGTHLRGRAATRSDRLLDAVLGMMNFEEMKPELEKGLKALATEG